MLQLMGLQRVRYDLATEKQQQQQQQQQQQNWHHEETSHLIPYKYSQKQKGVKIIFCNNVSFQWQIQGHLTSVNHRDRRIWGLRSLELESSMLLTKDKGVIWGLSCSSWWGTRPEPMYFPRTLLPMLFIHPNGCILDNKYKDMLLKKWMNKKRSELFVHSITWTEVLQVVLVLKNLSDNAKGKGIRDAGFISGLRRSPAGGNWNPL